MLASSVSPLVRYGFGLISHSVPAVSHTANRAQVVDLPRSVYSDRLSAQIWSTWLEHIRILNRVFAAGDERISSSAGLSYGVGRMCNCGLRAIRPAVAVRGGDPELGEEHVVQPLGLTLARQPSVVLLERLGGSRWRSELRPR